MSQINLSKVFPLEGPKQFKMHCAIYNGIKQPLDVFATDRNEWDGWNSYRGAKNEFNRPYIFSLIDFYHEKDVWLFGGIYKVLSVRDDGYEIERSDIGQEFVGRLKLSLKLGGRNRRVNFENYYDIATVTEILKEPYTGENFCGYENIDHDFDHLETIYKNQKQDWKAALQNVKGVYLIADKSNGKKYVGSAYGDAGIWSRWQCYIETGHGWNDGLTALIKSEGKDYARKNFHFTLLEYRSMLVDDQVIIDRESHWKRVLLTRGEFGYNNN